MTKSFRDKLKPFNAEIQSCPVCGKIDAYKGDNHSCGAERIKREREEYEWK